MTELLHASPLKPDQFDKAFALIQFAFREVSLERWRRHVQECDGQDDGNAGWIAVEDEKGYIHGLVAYRVEPDLFCGRIMVGRDIILGGVAISQAASCAIEGLSQMAWRTRCDAIHVMLPGYQDDELDRGLMGMKTCLLHAGFADRGGHLCRSLSGRCGR
jgi:hypothetical protein